MTRNEYDANAELARAVDTREVWAMRLALALDRAADERLNARIILEYHCVPRHIIDSALAARDTDERRLQDWTCAQVDPRDLPIEYTNDKGE